MTNTSEHPLVRRVLEQLDALNLTPSSTLLIAYSGGLDSHNLLCLATNWWRALAVSARPQLRAIHIDHGLQAASSEWAKRCAEVCSQLEVPLDIVPVKVNPRGSLELAARSARYKVFEDRLPARGILLQGHHLDDQAETVLHRLVLGHGLDGLSGIPRSRALGQGTVWRPFLSAGLHRSDLVELESSLAARGMPTHPVEDPSNVDTRFDRNYLRHKVLPTLLSRWPAARVRVAQSARYLSEAAELCDALAAGDLSQAQKHTGNFIGSDYLMMLPLDALFQWPESRQRNLLRYWLRRQSLSLSEGAWAELLDAVEYSAADSGQQAHFELAQPETASFDAQIPPQPWLLSLYQRALFVHKVVDPETNTSRTAGSLGFFEAAAPIDATLWPMQSVVTAPGPDQTVSCEPRVGATRVKVAGRSRTTTLKKLLSERRLLPWERDALPMICYDGEPVCMPGVFVAAAYAPPAAPHSADAGAAAPVGLLTVAWRPHGFDPAHHMVVIPPVIQ